MSAPDATPVIASDLDRTLIWSLRASGLAEGAPERDELTCVEIYDDTPNAFVTAAARTALETILRAGALVPVTTRTPAQYLRIELPGPRPPLAVCANGGRLVLDGEVDAEHSALVADLLASSAAPFAEVWEHLGTHARSTSGETWEFIGNVRSAEELFAYTVCHAEPVPEDWVAGLRHYAADVGWGVSVQGRKVYLVPTVLSKGWAVELLRERLGAGEVLAAGDSLLDAELLEVADRAMLPRDSELHRSGFARDHVVVTAEPGIRAGEEIACWMADALAPRPAASVAPGRQGP